MSDPSGTGGPGAEPRPRPQYGEYAPPGWVSPVTGEEPSSAPDAAPAAPQQQPVQQTPAPQQGAYDWGTPKPVRASGRLRTGDLVASVLLLGVGLFTGVLPTLTMAATLAREVSLSSLLGPEFLSLYEQMGIDAEGVVLQFGNTWPILAGVSVGIWLITAVLVVRRVRARRLAFWIPLVAGVLFSIVQFVALWLVFQGSPGAAEMLSALPNA